MIKKSLKNILKYSQEKFWIIPTMILLLGTTKISAQILFTNKQVYNFNPGDVMQTTNLYTQTPGPPIYETDSIVERWTSKMGDTINYKSKHTYFRAPSCQNCTAEIVVSTKKIIVADLDSVVKHENKTTQMELHDSFFTAFCNKNVWAKVPGKDDTLKFEPISHYTYVVEGLGGPYFHLIYRRQIPWINDRQLTYFKKAGVECGNYISGMEKMKRNQFELSIYPNPCADYTFLKFPHYISNAKISIQSLDGKFNETIVDINGIEYCLKTNNLNPGVYIISVSNNREMSNQKMIIQNF